MSPSPMTSTAITHIGAPRGDRLLRTRELAERLGLATSTIRAKRCRKSSSYDPSFPIAVRISRRATGYRESEVEAFIESRRVVSDTTEAAT